MDDGSAIQGLHNFVIRGLEPGYYDVFAYAWSEATVLVNGSPTGGPWPGAQVENVTFVAQMMVPVAGEVPLRISLEAGIGNTTDYSFIQGVQLVHHGASLGTNYCQPTPNSTGELATTVSYGSPFASSNLFVISATGLPQDTFGMFITSQTQGLVPNAGGGAGTLCLGGSYGRAVGGSIFNSGTSGTITAWADLTQHPTPMGPVAVMPGETWYIQAWFRDLVNGTHTSNYSDGHAMFFQ